jgi:predicted PhzF superfamily epimerase YddE/YHI9
VFVEDPGRGKLRIFTPTNELPFAGHPLVGTAWLLAREGAGTSVLRPPAGEVPMRIEDDFTYISGRPEWAPPFEHVELDSPAIVDELAGPPNDHDLVGAWAWEDKEMGHVRARVFPLRLGIEEDEATGAHAVLLCAGLGREIEIHQGKGSLIHARPRPDGTVEIGGRTELVEVHQYQ